MGIRSGAHRVRLASQADCDAVQRISEDAYRAAYLPVTGVVPRPGTEDYAPRIERGEVWVLEVGGDALGVAVFYPEAHHLVIYSLAVRPDRQGQGLGKALLAFAEQRAHAAGVAEMRLHTDARMVSNLELYRAVGFVETGRRPHPHLPDQTLVHLSKRIGPPEAIDG